MIAHHAVSIPVTRNQSRLELAVLQLIEDIVVKYNGDVTAAVLL